MNFEKIVVSVVITILGAGVSTMIYVNLANKHADKKAQEVCYAEGGIPKLWRGSMNECQFK